MLTVEAIKPHLRLGILDLQAFSEERGLGVKREIEREGTGFLLKEMLGKAPELLYTAENKPYLKGLPLHVSISHSHDKLAILLSEKESVGVDIEMIREKVLRIRYKFLSAEELNFTGKDVEKLITLWAAKESVYKIYGKGQVDFRTHIFVSAFADDASEFTAELRINGIRKSYKLQRRKIEDYILVLSIGEI